MIKFPPEGSVLYALRDQRTFEWWTDDTGQHTAPSLDDACFFTESEVEGLGFNKSVNLLGRKCVMRFKFTVTGGPGGILEEEGF